MSNTKPFIKWVGGKTQLLSEIEAHLPNDFDTHNNVVYYEPFIGGGAVMFHMIENHKNIKKVIVNDINPRLINCYKMVRDHVDVLIDYLTGLQREYRNFKDDETREKFYLKARETFNNKETSELASAAYLIFLNKTCYNGLYRENKKGEFNVPFGHYENPLICDPVTLRADSAALKNVEFVCGDFFNLIDFDKIDKNDGVYRFVYMDPPYIPVSVSAKFTQYTKNAFGEEEQKSVNDLAHICELYNIDVMISNSYAAGNVSNAYINFNKHIVYASRNVNSKGAHRGKIPEVLLTTYSDTKCSHKQTTATLL